MTTGNMHGGERGDEPMSDHDSAEFALFLQKEGELSRQLHALPQPESPEALDAAVLARIGAALAEERVPAVANDAAGPAVPPGAASPIRSRLRSRWAPLWLLSLGVAAGVLAVMAFRMTWQPPDAEAPQAALRDRPQETRAAEEDKKSEKSKTRADDAGSAVADTLPQRDAPPPAAPETAPKTKASAMPSVMAAPSMEPQIAAAPAMAPPVAAASPIAPPPASSPARVPLSKAAGSAYAASPQAQSPVQRVEITGQTVRRADQETAGVAQVVTASEIGHSGTGSADVIDKTPPEASGTELAWSRDPSRYAGREAPAYQAKPDTQSGYASLPMPIASPTAPAVAPVTPAERDVAALPSPRFALSDPASDVANRAMAPAEFVRRAPAPTVATAPPLSAAATVSPGSARVEIAGVSMAQRTQSGHAELRKRQLTDEARMRRRPSTWLALIEQQLKAQRDGAARDEWEKFRKIYPEYPVQRALAARLKSLQKK